MQFDAWLLEQQSRRADFSMRSRAWSARYLHRRFHRYIHVAASGGGSERVSVFVHFGATFGLLLRVLAVSCQQPIR